MVIEIYEVWFLSGNHESWSQGTKHDMQSSIINHDPANTVLEVQYNQGELVFFQISIGFMHCTSDGLKFQSFLLSNQV